MHSHVKFGKARKTYLPVSLRKTLRISIFHSGNFRENFWFYSGRIEACIPFTLKKRHDYGCR